MAECLPKQQRIELGDDTRPLNELLKECYGCTEPISLPDCEREFLAGKGFSGSCLPTLWRAYLDSIGLNTGDMMQDLRDWWEGNGCPAGGGGPVFYALTPDPDTYEMLGVRTGTGVLTTTHTSDLYAPDADGVYQKFPANAPVWSGGRAMLSGGAGSDVVSVFADDGAGAPLPEVPYLQYYPAATNSQIQSNDITQSNWNKRNSSTATFDQVGLTGAPNTASEIADPIDSTTGEIRSTAMYDLLTGDITTWVIYVKKDTENTVIRKFANNGFSFSVQLNTSTGEYVNYGNKSDAEVISVGGWWKIIGQVTETADGGAIYYRQYPAYNTDINSSASDALAIGACTIGNVERHLYKTIAEVRGLGPIFTTTAAVSTDISVYSFDIANHNEDAGAYYFENVPSIDAAEYNARTILLDTLKGSVNRGLYINASGLVELRTNTSGTSNIASPLPQKGVVAKMAANYSSAENSMQPNLNGTYGTLTTYTAPWRTSGTGVWLGNNGALVSYKLRELKRFDITSFQDGKDIIDGEMA